MTFCYYICKQLTYHSFSMLSSVKNKHVALVFTVLCSFGIFLSSSFAHKQSFNKLDFSNIFFQEGISSFSTNTSFSDLHLLANPVNTHQSFIPLVDFEIEEDEECSGFKKSFKSYLSSLNSFRVPGLNSVFKSARKVHANYSLPSFTKLPLYIKNQVFLI